MKYFFLVACVYFLNGCTKEEMTLYYAYLKNTTSHKIEIKPYFGGVASSDKTISLLANETKQIASGFDRGIVGNAGFNSQNLSGSDSLVVVFDNSYSITHYLNTPTSLSPKYYLFSSNRNLYNKNNYAYSYQDLSKHKRENNYNYNFVEQDYLDAR